MEHQPAADEVVACLSHDKDQLRHQEHDDEGHVARADSGVHYGLCYEREHQADYTRDKHRQQDLGNVGPVRAEIPHEVAELQARLLVPLLLVELRCGLQHQGDAMRLQRGFRGAAVAIPGPACVFIRTLEPCFQEGLFVISE